MELLPIDGLPLSLRCSVSRLPTLPGNLMVRHSLMYAPTFLRPSDFHDVLVVRSFQPYDSIRSLLEVSISVVLRKQSKVQVKFVDVSNEQEFIEAFNQFCGKIAIFDGHGAQSADDPQGALQVGNLQINPIQFYGKIQLPPIILLSAWFRVERGECIPLHGGLVRSRHVGSCRCSECGDTADAQVSFPRRSKAQVRFPASSQLCITSPCRN